MAKHVYSPEISSIWPRIEEFLELEDPHLPAALPKIIALLQARDHDLENALLGDLVVSDVSGSVGSIAPPKGQQISWSVNFGVVNGTPDGTGLYRVVYQKPFPTDTTIAIYLSADGVPQFMDPNTADRNGFSLRFFGALGPFTDPITGAFLAIGF